MKVDAWIQMGCERREVTFDVTEAEIERVGEDGLENYIEEAVTDWWACRYGYGWTCELFENDFSSLEDSEAGIVFTNEVLNPRTKRLLVHPRAG